MLPPGDPWETCTHGAMLVGHDLGPGVDGYLPSILPSLDVGASVSYAGRAWSVTDRRSVPKEQLGDELFDSQQTSRWIVTCDPDSGYRRWPDGQMHANNNVIVRLDPR